MFDFPGDRLQIYTDNESKYTQMRQALGACYSFKKEPLNKFKYPVKNKMQGSETTPSLNLLKESNTQTNLISETEVNKNLLSTNENPVNTQKIIELNKVMTLKNVKTMENNLQTLNSKNFLKQGKLEEIKTKEEKRNHDIGNLKGLKIQHQNEIEDISNKEIKQPELNNTKEIKSIEPKQSTEHKKKIVESDRKKELIGEKDNDIGKNTGIIKESKDTKLYSTRTTTSLPKISNEGNILIEGDNLQNVHSNNDTNCTEKRINLKFSSLGFTETASKKEDSKKEKIEMLIYLVAQIRRLII